MVHCVYKRTIKYTSLSCYKVRSSDVRHTYSSVSRTALHQIDVLC